MKEIKPRRNQVITTEMLQDMQEMHDKGSNYSEIGRKFNIRSELVRYHLNPKVREQRQKYIQRPDVKKRRAEYTTRYIRERYRNDPDFRAKFKEYVRRWNLKSACPQCGKPKYRRAKICKECFLNSVRKDKNKVVENENEAPAVVPESQDITI